METIYKSAGILIKNNKLLVEKSFHKEFFIAPGGKIEKNETPKLTLIRELKEEFNIDVEESNLEEFGEYSAIAAGHKDKKVVMKCFIVKSWKGEPKATSEVEKIMWVTSDIPKEIQVGSIFEHEVIPRLKKMNLID